MLRLTTDTQARKKLNYFVNAIAVIAGTMKCFAFASVITNISGSDCARFPGFLEFKANELFAYSELY